MPEQNGSGRVFDLHAHYVAPELIETLAREGGKHDLGVREEAEGRRRAVLAGVPTGLPLLPPLSNVPARLAWMDGADVARQLVAGWMDLAGYHLEPAAAQWLARLQNETTADLVRTHPDRFLGAAMVPLQDPALAADELRHAVRTLGLRAVQIGTNVNGLGLDEPELDPFWAAVSEADVPIVVHPAELGGPERQRRYFMHILVGNPSETTWAAGALLLGGVLERFPNLRVLLVHGGGFVPYQMGRLSRGFAAAPPNAKARATRPPESFANALYFDSILHDARALRYLVAVAGAGHVVAGSDYPFPMQDTQPRQTIEGLGATWSDTNAMLFGNAERLLGAGASA